MSKALSPHNAAQQALAKQRESMAARIAGLGSGEAMQFIKGKAGHWVFPDGTRIAGELPVVVLDWGFHYSYWKNQYVQGQSEPPVCVATGQDARSMTPSPNSPEVQHDGPCATCRHNQFGSGGGNRKACKNTVMLAVMRYDDEIEDDTIYFVNVPPSALKDWGKYASKLDEKGWAPAQVVTILGFDSKVDYPKPIFSADRAKTQEYLAEDEEGNSYFVHYAGQMQKATEALMRDPAPASDEE